MTQKLSSICQYVYAGAGAELFRPLMREVFVHAWRSDWDNRLPSDADNVLIAVPCGKRARLPVEIQSYGALGEYRDLVNILNAHLGPTMAVPTNGTAMQPDRRFAMILRRPGLVSAHERLEAPGKLEMALLTLGLDRTSIDGALRL